MPALEGGASPGPSNPIVIYSIFIISILIVYVTEIILVHVKELLGVNLFPVSESHRDLLDDLSVQK